MLHIKSRLLQVSKRINLNRPSGAEEKVKRWLDWKDIWRGKLGLQVLGIRKWHLNLFWPVKLDWARTLGSDASRRGCSIISW